MDAGALVDAGTAGSGAGTASGAGGSHSEAAAGMTPNAGRAGGPGAGTQSITVAGIGAQTDAAPVDSGAHDGGAIACEELDCCEPDGCAQEDPLDPRLLGVWHFAWMGGNLSYFQIAICGGGRANYLFASAPGDPSPLRAEGSYMLSSPTRLQVEFVLPMTMPSGFPALSAHQSFELELDEAFGGPRRLGESDGYSNLGAAHDPEVLMGPATHCEP